MELNYASRPFMVRGLENMGLTGTAATQRRRFRHLPGYDDDGTNMADRTAATAGHERKHDRDQGVDSYVQSSLSNAQQAMFHSRTVASTPRVVAENPYDVWVDQRAHLFRQSQQHVSDRELVNANEPWRMYSDVKLDSIKHTNTK